MLCSVTEGAGAGGAAISAVAAIADSSIAHVSRTMAPPCGRLQIRVISAPAFQETSLRFNALIFDLLTDYN